MIKTVNVTDMPAPLTAFLRENESGAVVITQNGRAVGLLLAVTDDDELERLVLANSPKFQQLLERSRQEFREGKGIPHDQFWRELDAEYEKKKPKPKTKPKKRRLAKPAR